ncbi:MAG: MlaD family protein [Bacteroidales bacterium]|nr:MlaD family protein [Bacteroidales bacterium]
MKKADELKIGIWTIVSIVALVFGIKFLKGQLHTSTVYYMVSPNVERVAESSHVKINGYNVGFVGSMHYNYDDNSVVLGLYLDPSLRLPRGTSAIIQPDLLGTSNIYLTLGQSTETLAPGDTLLGGGMAAGLTDGIAEAMPAVMALLPKVDSLLTGLNVLVHESRLQESLLAVNGLTHKLDRTLSELNRQLPSILNNVDNASANLDTLSAELRQAQVQQLIDQANATLDSVSLLVAALNDTQGTAGKLINSDQLHSQLEGTLADIDSLVADIKAHPKRYINIKLFGK